MLVPLLVSTFLHNVHGLKITAAIEPTRSDHVLPCIANITRQYFAYTKKIVYLKSNYETDHLLKFLHSMEAVSFDRRSYANELASPNLAYVISVRNVENFFEQVTELVTEGDWNPYAQFLVVIKSVTPETLREVFDWFLHHRVKDVVVMNGTGTTELYTYNPFENFACGNYYTRFIYFGKCPDVTANIYPVKLTTGLRKCNFKVFISHWPPYGIDPSRTKSYSKVKPMGTDHYIFNLISEIEQFKYESSYETDSETFSLVSKNMTISGPMLRLAQNKSDVMLGGLLLIPSRMRAFSYIYGHLDYIDELRLMVKKAEVTPPWKDIYFEFSLIMWVLLLLVLVLYSALLTILLKAKDKGYVILMLLDSLLAHGTRFRSRQSVNYVVIIWVIFAYFVNSFYTTNLMSLTMEPRMNYQIRDEETAIARRLEPCISKVMGNYLKAEDNHGEIVENAKIATAGCEKFFQSIRTVSKSNALFTIVIYSIYHINRQQFCDEYGKSTVYSFSKPYSKIIYAMYFNKGFPMRERLHKLALRIREVGLSEKSLRDRHYDKVLKYRFRSRGYVARFAIPWYLYGIGVFISTITFVVELSSRYNKTMQ